MSLQERQQRARRSALRRNGDYRELTDPGRRFIRQYDSIFAARAGGT
jgi:hypothetical protein